MKQVLVLGNQGYVGSRLTQILETEYQVEGIDLGLFVNIDNPKDYRSLTEAELEKYDCVVLVAGHSSVLTCNGDIRAPWSNNVTNFVNLVKKLRKDQLVVYASSASVYGNSDPGKYYTEQLDNFAPVNNYDLTKYTLDLHSQLLIDQGYNIVGLRFGTVNGWSPYIRTDVMINAMYTSAKTNGKITITNKTISRAILGIEDLCDAVKTIIQDPHVGIYNLSSFNTTVDEIASAVANKLAVPVIDNGNTNNVYDFGLDCSQFKKTFNFNFKETPSTIVTRLAGNYDQSRLGRRDDYIKYE